MLESTYQTKVIKKLRVLFPGCVILKNDANYQQGIPDWILLYGRYWAMLEIKPSKDARRQPNQPWFVEELNKLSFAAFIFPENEKEVLRAIQSALQP